MSSQAYAGWQDQGNTGSSHCVLSLQLLPELAEGELMLCHTVCAPSIPPCGRRKILDPPDRKSLFYAVSLPTLETYYLKGRKLHREITDAKSAFRK